MVFMGPGVKLRNARMIHFGKGVTLETGVIIDGLSRNGVVLGNNVSIGANCHLNNVLMIPIKY